MDASVFTNAKRTLGLTDIQLAEALGVTRFAVFRWRKGQRKVPAAVIKLMQQMLDNKKPR